jgi:hypothetical protein
MEPGKNIVNERNRLKTERDGMGGPLEELPPGKKPDKRRQGLRAAQRSLIGKNQVKRFVPECSRQFVNKAEFIRIRQRGEGKPPSWVEKTHHVLEVRARSAIGIVDQNIGGQVEKNNRLLLY